MAEQPRRLAELIARRDEIGERVRPLFANATGTVVVARGSSDHAATTGRYLLEMATCRPVASASPSVSTLYEVPTNYDGYVVIALSQSGRTPEITHVLQLARERGARTIAVTNDGSSPLAQAAEVVIDLAAGAEKAVPATKTVTGEMVALGIVAGAVAAGFGPTGDEWRALPDQVAAVLDDAGPMEEIAEWLHGARSERLAVVARGILMGAAAETALKLEETSLVLATGLSGADLRHGPIALASGGLPVVAYAHPGPAEPDVLRLVAELTLRGADVRVIGPVAGSSASWDATAPESLAPVLAVVRGQQLARASALARGLDPDAPGGLTKVTVT